MEDEKLAKRADAQKVEGKWGGEEDGNCDGEYIRSALTRVGDEWK